MTTGSHHQQIYWYATGSSRMLGQLPAIWLTADRRWIPRRAAVMRPPGGAHVSETGGWNGICVACHTTNGQPQLDTPLGSQPILTQTADTRATEFGIACESCHGPSDAHARANRNPLRRYASHLTGARRRDDRPAGEAAAGALVAGLRPVPLVLGVRRSGRASATRTRTACPIARATSSRRRASSSSRPGTSTRRTMQRVPRSRRRLHPRHLLVRRHGARHRPRIQRPRRVALLQERDRSGADDVVLLVPHDAPDGRRPAAGRASGPTISSRRTRTGNGACVQCHERLSPTHTSSRPGLVGQLLLQLPHAVHDLRPAEDDPQPSDQQPVGAVDARRPAGRTRATCVTSTRRSRGRRSTSNDWYGVAKPSLDSGRKLGGGVGAVLLKGDAGQRAIVAQSMGWPAAQQASGTRVAGAVPGADRERFIRCGPLHRVAFAAHAAAVPARGAAAQQPAAADQGGRHVQRGRRQSPRPRPRQSPRRLSRIVAGCWMLGARCQRDWPRDCD